jgi:uncharacterized membrane protein YfcA
MPFAIGTDLAHIFGKSIIATKKHSRLGNVDWRLGLFSIFGSIMGIEAGKRFVLMLERTGDVGTVVRWVYMIFLFGLGAFMVCDYFSAMRLHKKLEQQRAGDRQPVEVTAPMAVKLRRISIPPMIALPASGIEMISFWVVFLIFLLTGFLSGFMGVGGGFILLPALIYMVGCPTTVAVGTSLLSVCFMSGYGCFTYSLSGRTELIAAMLMLIGAAVGAQIGVMATKYIKGYGIRLLFAIMIILAGLSVAFKQAQEILEISFMNTLAAYFVMGSAGSMTILIFVRLIMGIKKENNDRL